MKIRGKVWKYGDDINTDYIFPGIYTYVLMSEQEMGSHAMEGVDQNFTEKASKGDIIVAGKNWGCGSSREQAVKCLKARGIGALIVKSAARIFYRNAINEGFPVIVCPEAAETTEAGEQISIDLDKGRITNSEGVYQFTPYPEHIKKLMESGGLLPYIKKRLGNK